MEFNMMRDRDGRTMRRGALCAEYFALENRDKEKPVPLIVIGHEPGELKANELRKIQVIRPDGVVELYYHFELVLLSREILG